MKLIEAKRHQTLPRQRSFSNSGQAARRTPRHLPHHDEGDDHSEHVYAREEARLVPQVTAASVSYGLKG